MSYGGGGYAAYGSGYESYGGGGSGSMDSGRFNDAMNSGSYGRNNSYGGDSFGSSRHGGGSYGGGTDTSGYGSSSYGGGTDIRGFGSGSYGGGTDTSGFGGGRDSSGFGGSSFGGGRDKYAAYETSRSRDDSREDRKRLFGDRDGGKPRGGGGFGGGGRGRGGQGPQGKPRQYDPEIEHELLVWDNPPRPDREPELNLFIDSKFNYWNLPVKAKVLLVSNVPKELCQPDFLFYLFSFYGDVERVKIIRKKQNCALLEFSTATFAAVARDHLDGTSLLGENIAVTFSRFERVSLPSEFGQENDVLTKDFSGPMYQSCKRYATEDLKKLNMKKIVKPTCTLHVGNIQVGKSPNDIKQNFEGFGFPVLDCIGIKVRLSKKAEDDRSGVPRMYCYLEMRSLDDAILGLAQLSSPSGMRISFSRESVETLRQQALDKGEEILTGNQQPQ